MIMMNDEMQAEYDRVQELKRSFADSGIPVVDERQINVPASDELMEEQNKLVEFMLDRLEANKPNRIRELTSFESEAMNMAIRAGITEYVMVQFGAYSFPVRQLSRYEAGQSEIIAWRMSGLDHRDLYEKINDPDRIGEKIPLTSSEGWVLTDVAMTRNLIMVYYAMKDFNEELKALAPYGIFNGAVRGYLQLQPYIRDLVKTVRDMNGLTEVETEKVDSFRSE